MLVFRARGGQIYRRGVGGSARCERIWRCYSISHGEGGLRKKRVFPALSNEATEVPGGLYRSGVILRGGRAGRALLPLPRRTASFPEPMPRPSACFFFAMNFTFFLPPLTPEVVLQSQPKSAHANCFLWFVCGWVFFFFFSFSICPSDCHSSVYLSLLMSLHSYSSRTGSRKVRSVEGKEKKKKKKNLLQVQHILDALPHSAQFLGV